MKIWLIVLLGLIFIGGCSDEDCSEQMADIKAKYGTAEEVTTYDSKDYHNVDWWYWSKGFQYSFTWGSNIDGCDMSKYTFEPITASSANDEAKASAKESKVLIERSFCPGATRPTQ